MSGTSGGWAGTSAGRRALGLAVASGVALIIAGVNASGVVHDAVGPGSTLDAWEPWVWELTSVAYWVAVLPLLWRIEREVRPPRLRWALTVAAYLALTVPVSAAHLAWLAALRPPIYALLGSHYRPDWSRAQLIYEYRKDVLVTLMLLGVGVAVDLWARAAAGAPAAPAAPPYRLEVRDGPRVLWLAPAEIERVEAAGNYVELHTARGAVLHRATLTAVEAELGCHGFVRIHRSRLVRRDAVTAVATTPAGDFEATLASGARVAGSRRFRAGLA